MAVVRLFVARESAMLPPRGRYFARTAGFAPPGPCDGSAYSWIVFNNAHELADQVKQASLLDALGVPWRRGACR